MTFSESKELDNDEAGFLPETTSGGQMMSQEWDNSISDDDDDVHVVELRVPICCESCEEQIMDHLLEMSGVAGVLCDQNQQKVTVSGSVAPADVLKACKKLFESSELWRD